MDHFVSSYRLYLQTANKTTKLIETGLVSEIEEYSVDEPWVLDVEAPGWQGAKAQEYRAYFELLQRSQTGCIGV